MARWNDTSWIARGDRVQLVAMEFGRKTGERLFGSGIEPNIVWVRVGDVGVVTNISKGYPAHSCPDHKRSPDCMCGELGDPGIIPELESWATVEYMGEGGGVVKQAIRKDREGINWKRY